MIVISVNCSQGNGTFQSRCLFFDYLSEILDVRGAEHWNRLSERLWSRLSWRCSEAVRTQSWPPCSRGTLLEQGGWPRWDSVVLSNLNYSVKWKGKLICSLLQNIRHVLESTQIAGVSLKKSTDFIWLLLSVLVCSLGISQCTSCLMSLLLLPVSLASVQSASLLSHTFEGYPAFATMLKAKEQVCSFNR